MSEISKSMPCGFAAVAPLLLVFLLAACGGGSARSTAQQDTPPPAQATQPTADDIADAKSAQLTGSMNLSAGMATLTWRDKVQNVTGYRIEQQNEGGTWTAIDTIPGRGDGTTLTWSHAVNAQTTFRVAAVKTGYTVPLPTFSGQDSLVITLPATAPAIALADPEPLLGPTIVSVTNAASYISATYYLDHPDQAGFGSSTTVPDFAVSLNTGNVTAGAHVVLAQLKTGPDFTLQLQRTVQVANPELAMSMRVDNVSPTVQVVISATSDYGIQSVMGTLDGKSLGTPTVNQTGQYVFSIDSIAAGSGDHVIAAVVTDGNGKTASATQTVKFDNPPMLTITGVADGDLVNSTLHLAGTASSDKTGTVSVVVTLGEVTILNTTTSPFSTDFSLTGITPGNYTLTAKATDPAGTTSTKAYIVTVTSAAGLVHTPLIRLGAASLLATGPNSIVYDVGGQQANQHLLYGTNDVVLGTGYGPWLISDPYAFALGSTYPPGSTIPNGDVIAWNSAGVRTDLGLLGASGALSLLDLTAAHGPWALGTFWGYPQGASVGVTSFVFFNAQTSQRLAVPALPDATIFGSASHGQAQADFSASSGHLRLYFMKDLGAQPGDSPETSHPIGISSWDQNTAQVTDLANDPTLLQFSPRTDGVRLAWESRPRDQSDSRASLVALDLASSTRQTLSSTVTQFQLNAGLLAWAEATVSNAAIKVSDGTTVTTLSTRLSGHLYGTDGGYVLFGEDSKLYVWSPSAGRQLVFDSTPGTASIAGKTVYFTNGTKQALYAVPQN